jgi:4'-phosphopantetheinyl transferase
MMKLVKFVNLAHRKDVLIIVNMPLFYQHNINQQTKLGIWHITEPESFFLEKVPLKKDVSHPSKRLQHLAGRYLLPFLFPDFPLEEILIADTRKPFLQSEKYHFSISHSGQFAAAIVSSHNRVGVDIERITTRIKAISHKFLHPEEEHFLNEDYNQFLEQWGLKEKIVLELLTLIWSAKESIFKWHGTGELDFRKHMQLQGYISTDGDWLTLPFVFDKEKKINLTIEARIFDDLVLAWVRT